MIAGSAVQKFGQDLESHQQILLAAADILIEIYMAESTLLRTEKNAKRNGKESQAIEIAMTQLYLYDAVDIVIRKGKEALVSFAEGDEQKMMLMGLKRFTKYINQPNVVALRNQIADKVAADNAYTFDS
jgi:alkylation response protein AidB-like acyl-CoA dehydrogenase